ncbi:MAG: hypothetical protein ACXW1Y_12425 [Acidimicrobiia bacterium]
MTLRVLIKGEVDVARAFGVEGGSSSGPALFSGSGSGPIELIVEPPVRTEVLAQQLAAADSSSSAFATTRAADPDIDVVVLSIAGDLTRDLYRKPASGELVDAGNVEAGSIDYEPADSDFETSAASVVERLAAANAPLVIWFTASTVNGEDEPHRWGEGEEPFSMRANRLNLSLARLSQKTGVCFVDADRLLAELGAGEHVEGPLQYSAQASGRLGEEFVRILVDTGKLEPVSVGQENLDQA